MIFNIFNFNNGSPTVKNIKFLSDSLLYSIMLLTFCFTQANDASFYMISMNSNAKILNKYHLRPSLVSCFPPNVRSDTKHFRWYPALGTGDLRRRFRKIRRYSLLLIPAPQTNNNFYLFILKAVCSQMENRFYSSRVKIKSKWEFLGMKYTLLCAFLTFENSR